MDAKTIERARRGDRAAQAALLRGLQDPWYRLCRTLLPDDERARDATQETALRFLRDLRRFQGQSTLTTWSIGIALNVVRELRRTEHPNAPHSLHQLAAAQRAASEPHQTAQHAEEIDLIRSTLSELSDRQREAIILRFFEDLTIDQTAAAMGCATGTVKATVHQALRVLRAKLRQLA